jgi:hypothetical protein
MGMTLQTTWSCERCDTTQVEEVGVVPDGWKFVIEPQEVMVKIEGSSSMSVDMSMGGLKLVLICKACVGSYYEWFGPAEEPNLLDDIPTPVVPSDGGSGDNLASDGGL